MKAWKSLWSFVERRSALKSFVRFNLLVGDPPTLDIPPLIDKVLVRFPWSSGLWWTHFPFLSSVTWTTSIHFHQQYCVRHPPWYCPTSRMVGPWCRVDLPFCMRFDACFSCLVFFLIHGLLWKFNQSQDLCILGIFGGPPYIFKKVVVPLQFHGPYLFFREISVLFPLSPPVIQIVPVDWEQGWVVEVELMPRHLE